MEEEKVNNDGGFNHLKDSLVKFGKFVVIFLFVFVIIYLLLNFNSLYSQVKYWFETDIKETRYQSPVIRSQLPSPYLSSGTPTVDSSVKNNINSSNSSGSNNENISITNNQMVIPEIDIRAPILWNIPADNAIDRLREGLVHIKQTALPGESDGNVFITGHSSYYPWDPGKYKHIFALLPNIKKGDKIYIQYHGTLYKYEIFETVTVKPDDTWVMQPSNKNMVSLMTCVPIGTSLRRFVVRAQQIKPSPAASVARNRSDQTISSPDKAKEVSEDLMPRIFN